MQRFRYKITYVSACITFCKRLHMLMQAFSLQSAKKTFTGAHRPLKSIYKPSIDDVARLAGFSTATVSRSLNEPGRVKPATLKAVQDAISQLGYTPHFGGRALASNKSNTIGAIIPTMDNAIFARGLQALQETLTQAGITLLQYENIQKLGMLCVCYL